MIKYLQGLPAQGVAARIKCLFKGFKSFLLLSGLFDFLITCGSWMVFQGTSLHWALGEWKGRLFDRPVVSTSSFPVIYVWNVFGPWINVELPSAITRPVQGSNKCNCLQYIRTGQRFIE